MNTPKIIIRHYAFNEGRTGCTNGCKWTDNPYPATEIHDANRKAHLQWLNGWDYQNDQPVDSQPAEKRLNVTLIRSEIRFRAHHVATEYLTEHFDGQDFGACGFAWVTIHPEHKGTTKAGKAERKLFEALGASKDHTGKNWQIWNPADVNAQNIDCKEAGAREAAKILQGYGFKAFAHSRMD